MTKYTDNEIKRLLGTPDALLNSIEKQEKFLYQQAVIKAPCPACTTPTSQLDACEGEYDVGRSHDSTYRCPACKARLAVTIPLMVYGVAKWHWRVTPEGK